MVSTAKENIFYLILHNETETDYWNQVIYVIYVIHLSPVNFPALCFVSELQKT